VVRRLLALSQLERPSGLVLLLTLYCTFDGAPLGTIELKVFINVLRVLSFRPRPARAATLCLSIARTIQRVRFLCCFPLHLFSPSPSPLGALFAQPPRSALTHLLVV
jgi:hypothetical protein